MKRCESEEDDNFLQISEIKKKIKKGEKYIVPPEVPDNYREMITKCWSKNEEERWTMEQIVHKMESGELDLPGYDKKEFQKYVKRLKEAERKKEKLKFGSDDDEDEAPKKKPKKAASIKKFKPKITPV